MTAEVILSLMLMLATPGKSIYSQTSVEQGSPAPCSEPSLACKAPWYSNRRKGWYRVETWNEGLQRYWKIAQAVALAEKNAHTQRIMLAIMFNESGFRKDVHSGVSISEGKHKDGRLVETGRGDNGKSWCLGQFNLGRTAKQGKQLIGTSPEATERCVAKISKAIKRCRGWCAWDVNTTSPSCIFAAYGGNIALMGSKPIRRRVNTLARLRSRKLTTEERQVLGLDSTGGARPQSK